MLHLVLSAWIAFGVGDAASTRIARDRFVRNRPHSDIFGEAPVMVDIQAIYPQVLGAMSTRVLWTHGHKKAAVLLTVADFAWKGYVIHHNLSIK